MKKSFIFKAENMVEANHELDIKYIYVNPSVLASLIDSHYGRPIYKISNVKSKNSIIREIKGKSIKNLFSNNITMDYLNAKELNAKDETVLIVTNPSAIERYILFFYKNPDATIRYSFHLCLIGVIATFITMFLTLI